MELPNKHATCPNCGEKLDGATTVTNDQTIPKEGDIGICLACGTLLEYEEGFFVHELSEENFEALKITDEDLYYQILVVQSTIKMFSKIKPPSSEETGILYFDENCIGCIYYVNCNQCELDTDDDSPCFRYDHYTPLTALN